VEIVVETIQNLGEPSARSIRVRPLPGQFDREYRVWCSVSEREAKSMRGCYRVVASWVVPVGRERYLRISPSERWVPIDREAAAKHIEQNDKRRSKP
jgi:hypothetical protein